MFAADLLGILRMAVETRKTALLDLSLDLIQKLIAHQHLAGAVHSISHKRELAAARTGRKVRSRCPQFIPSKTLVSAELPRDHTCELTVAEQLQRFHANANSLNMQIPDAASLGGGRPGRPRGSWGCG